MPKSVLLLINNYKVSLIFSSKIYSFYSNAFKEALGSENGEYAQKCLSALNKFQEALDANPNLSLSNDFRVSFKALSSLLKQPEKHNIYSHLFLAITAKVDFYISSKPLLNKTKKLYESIPESDRSNLLQITTFQEIFETYIGLELRDIAYGSKKYDFYIVDEGINEWDKIEHMVPQNIGAEYFGFKEKKDILKKNKTLKFYGLTKFGKGRVKKRRINKSLLDNIENLPHNYLEPFTNIEPSYIEIAKFDQVNWLYQRLVDLKVQGKPLIFLDSSLVFQLLLNFERKGKKLPSEFTEQILNQYEFVCLPGVLFDLEEAGYTEFVRDLLKEIINLPKLLEIEKFIVNYQNKLDEYGFSNLNVEILSDSVYWNFYVQFHSCVAKFLNADSILIPSDLKKYYLNKNCYNGKFSFFVDPDIKPTSLKCVTAQKFWKKIKLEKRKAESDNLKDFIVSSNFKEWEVPECLGEILRALDRKLIQDVNSFWLEIFRRSENQVENEKYFKVFIEFINKFEEIANLLKSIPQFSSLIDNSMHSRTNFSDIKDYTRKIKRVFSYLIEINKKKGFINSTELYLLVLLFKSNISNFLRDRFYLKAKFKSPELPTTINFDVFYKDGVNQQELSSIIPTIYKNNNLQKIIVKNKGKNKSSLRFEPNLHYNDDFIFQLFRKFLFTNYCFHKSKLRTVYRDFIRFIKAKKEYRAIAKGFSFNSFESLILNNQERYLIQLEPHGIYYSKLLGNFLILIQTYHRVQDNSLSIELSAKTLNIKESELEIFVYSLIQNGHMFREKSASHPKYSLFLQAVKELNDKSTKLSQAKAYSPSWFPKKKNKIVLHQPDLWIESESKILDNTPIYYINKKNRVSYSDKTFNVQIKGETFAADVDTGAFKSLISKDIAERLFPKQKRYKAYVSGYTQHTKHVDMIRGVPFHYNGQEFTDDFLIEENLEKIFKAEVVIGRGGYNKMLVRYYGKTLENLFEAKDSDRDNNEKVKVNKVKQIQKSFLTYTYKLKVIRNKIALYFFDSDIDHPNEKVRKLKEKIQNSKDLQFNLTQSEQNKLQQMFNLFPTELDKYFLDLVKIIEFLKNRGINLKIINAHLLVKPTCEYLYKRGITLFYKPSTFVRAVTEIFDYLKEKHQDFFPNRVKISSTNDKKHNSERYRLILGYNLKLYLMKTIYDGRYIRNGRLYCPECFKEGNLINTNELRLTSLEFHHSTGEKENEYTAHQLSRIYQKQSSNEQFLEELIKKMENERVIVLCRNHHHILHSKYFPYFSKLINWKNIPLKFPQDIFSLPPELILLLIKISIENFSNTKNESYHTKMYIRNTIARYLKKRYLIEQYYGKVCHSCGEFSLSGYLPSFDFHHYSGKKFQNNPYLHSKIKDASQLFIQSYTCSEIAQILEYEKGGFICRNCHNVLEYKLNFLDLLEEIYHKKNIIQMIRDDYKSTNQKFQIFHTPPSIKNPLSINTQITETYEKYLNAIYDLTQQNRIITIANLAQNLDCNRVTVLGILKAKEFFFNIFLNKEIGKNRLKIFILTKRGNNYIELIHYLKDYYRKKSLIKI